MEQVSTERTRRKVLHGLRIKIFCSYEMTGKSFYFGARKVCFGRRRSDNLMTKILSAHFRTQREPLYSAAALLVFITRALINSRDSGFGDGCGLNLIFYEQVSAVFLRLATLSHFKRETDVLQCCCHSATNSTSWSCVKIHEKTQQESYCIANVWKKATDSAKQTPLKNYRIRASIIQINIDFPPSVELVHVWCLLLTGVVASVCCGLSVVW